MCKIISSSNGDSFTFFFPPVWVPFIFFLPNCLVRISSTMLNQCGQSEHPCLVTGLKVKAFSLSLLSM